VWAEMSGVPSCWGGGRSVPLHRKKIDFCV